ncbi:MAG TPA: PEP-CTERM sorting domain-containing protein [Stellaceae bacterium]|jgi:hypothetical protein|nr:PEP-CTERM sorting domain-containing protein [Stellaceae bacterium]
MHRSKPLALVAAAAGLCVATVPAHAGLIVDGLTYSLTETALTATTAQFDLSITGINATSDTEKGRYGVDALAFNLPSNLLSVTAPSGFTYETGGLNANGCNGSGNFFCLKANTTPASSVLAANSSLNFVFDLTLSSGSWASYNWSPDFKIDWDGTKNNYNLVSQTLTPSVLTQTPITVPEPSSLAVVGGGLIGLGYLLRRQRKLLQRV